MTREMFIFFTVQCYCYCTRVLYSTSTVDLVYDTISHFLFHLFMYHKIGRVAQLRQQRRYFFSVLNRNAKAERLYFPAITTRSSKPRRTPTWASLLAQDDDDTGHSCLLLLPVSSAEAAALRGTHFPTLPMRHALRGNIYMEVRVQYPVGSKFLK